MPPLSYCDVHGHLVNSAPVPIKPILTDDGRRETKPKSVGISKPRFKKCFSHQPMFNHNAGLYIFWWKGGADSLPQDTLHWVKGKQQGKDDPTEEELDENAIYFSNKPDDETDDETTTKQFLHYRGGVEVSYGRNKQ